jgi:hypothetical protein
MRLRKGLALGVCLLTGSAAWADINDLRLAQLGNPDPASSSYDPLANAHFRIFARQLAAALTSTNLTPPGTTGHSGFAMNLELSVADLRPGGTFVMPTEQPFGSPLLIPSLHLRKGLPFSFELGTRIAWLDRSRMFAGTGELKWAVNEGFYYLPDLAIRAHGTRLFNTRDLDLTAAGLDIGLGKKFPLGGMITLTPYAGWNLIWVAASSSLVDFNPGRTQAQAEQTPTSQLQDSGVYDELSMSANSHNRFYLGLRFIGGIVQIAAEVSYANLGIIKVPSAGDPNVLVDYSLPRVLSYNTTLGLDF